MLKKLSFPNLKKIDRLFCCTHDFTMQKAWITINVCMSIVSSTAFISTASSKELFELNGSVLGPLGTEQASAGFSKIEDLVDSLSDAGLNSIFRSYTSTSEVNTSLFIRGLPATAAYAAGSTTLRFQVPSAGIDLSFTGATRDESEDQFKDFLKKSGSDILSRMLKELVANSPVDPIAGNPNSLQSQMGAQTFGIATGFGVIGEPGTTPSSGQAGGVFQRVPNLVTVGGDVGWARSGGYDSYVANLPIRYSLYFSDPRYALTFDLPLTYVRTEGAQSAFGSFGTSFRFPVVENWYLTPSARVGASGSLDLGAAALMYSADLTSLYNIYAGEYKFGIANGFGYYRSSKLSVGDVSIDYNLQNTALKNGINVEGPLNFSLFDRPTSWQAYVIDTHMFGDELFLQHFDEVGLIVGTRPSMDGQSWDSFRLGLAYTFGSDYNAIKASFGYRF
jgi:hypothetical protein